MPTQSKAEFVSVQQVCNLLSRLRLLQPEEVRTLFARWRTDAGAAVDDVQQFRRWLVARHYVTEFQADRLVRGKTDHYFFNQYKLLDRIGIGRMAGVYKAVHRLGPTVAIKVLPPSRAKIRDAFERFKREARLAIKLRHPHVVRTYQIGKAEGLYYLVMEYLEGETLKDVLQKRGKLAPTEAVRLVYQALLGLEHIHQQGMVHRDLTPVNLMLVPPTRSASLDPATATVKVLDIGLGREVFDEDAPAQNRELTAPGTILGTPEYMSPEQAKDSRTVDIRSDIYSLGCVLFHCLAGRPPFVHPKAVQVIVQQATQPAPPLKMFNSQVPDSLQQIVTTMLAKDPEQRYATPERAAQALQVFLAATQLQGALVDDAAMQAYLQWLVTQVEPEDPEEDEEDNPPGTLPVVTVSVSNDVELVSVQPGTAGGASSWGPREWQLLGVGAGALVLLAGLGWFLLRLLFRNG